MPCQILPAGFPSYQRYCPYTASAGNGFWHGPDLSKAMRLARESGTSGTPVAVWNMAGNPTGAYVVHLLKQLGYRATLRNVSDNQFYAEVGSNRRIQIGLNGWAADYPSASDYFLPVLTCRSFSQDPTSTYNYAEFCDPQADSLASEALATQLADPAAAGRLWSRVDRMVTDQAPWVPIFNESPWTVFVFAQVGNYQEPPYYGPLLDQIWVR